MGVTRGACFERAGKCGGGLTHHTGDALPAGPTVAAVSQQADGGATAGKWGGRSGRRRGTTSVTVIGV